MEKNEPIFSKGNIMFKKHDFYKEMWVSGECRPLVIHKVPGTFLCKNHIKINHVSFSLNQICNLYILAVIGIM